MELKGENYRISYDPLTGTITCQGGLRLQGIKGYASVMELLNDIADLKPETIILDMRELRFLNSSGIATFSKFVIRVRNTKASQLIIRGTREFPWQTVSLKNMRRLMSDIVIEFE